MAVSQGVATMTGAHGERASRPQSPSSGAAQGSAGPRARRVQAPGGCGAMRSGPDGAPAARARAGAGPARLARRGAAAPRAGAQRAGPRTLEHGLGADHDVLGDDLLHALRAGGQPHNPAAPENLFSGRVLCGRHARPQVQARTRRRSAPALPRRRPPASSARLVASRSPLHTDRCRPCGPRC